ncbi:MAG: hypothetical protein WKF67_12580 [Rubrobacteraceae bacterium]
MPGWGKLVAGAVIGAAGALYATNEELRKQLPRTARDLPVTVRRRFKAARTAGQEASARRRAEILRELEAHGGDHTGRRSLEAPAGSLDALPGAPPETPAATGEFPVRPTKDV